MSRMKILWLVSWYPNVNDRYDGDFIQRHARAAALIHDIHVIFVTALDMEKPREEIINHVTGLTEQMVYYKKRSGLFRVLQHHYMWEQLFRKAVRQYIEKNGMPACVHVHVPWKAGMIGMWVKNKYRLPFILSEHWGIYTNELADNFQSRSTAFRKIMNRIYKGAGGLVTVSHFLAAEVQKIMSKKADAVIPNVVDTSLFYSRDEKYSKFTFIHVSNMAPVKNVRGILEAFQSMIKQSGRSDVQLLMIGNRDNEMPKLAGSMGLMNSVVFFRGEIHYSEVAEEMRRSNCFVIFSSSETFSCVTAEALCCGLPVIASDTGALPELVNENNGILVPPGDIRLLARAMTDVLNGARSFQPGKISSDAAGKYGYPAVSEHFKDLYNAIC